MREEKNEAIQKQKQSEENEINTIRIHFTLKKKEKEN